MARSAHAYLLVFCGEKAALAPLPRAGEVSIGRGEGGELVVRDGEVLPGGARLQVRDGTVELLACAGADVKINGQAPQERRGMAAGDVLSFGKDRVVFYRDPRRSSGADLLDAAGLTRRLEQEVERASRYNHNLAVICLRLGREPEQQQRNRFKGEVSGALRSVDMVGWDGALEVMAVLPETGETARVPARRLLKAVSGRGHGARAGLAIFPDDGLCADALLTAARGAARRVAPGALGGASEGYERIEVPGGGTVVAVDPKTRHLFGLARSLARGRLPVLITGETGVGKEIFARALHQWSPRHAAPLVTLNCAAVAETLLESELFGHEAGAFSGAVAAKQGLLESADGGTIFLDEVGESSPQVQASLLRALETGFIRRVGAVKERPVDVRVIAATNRPLSQAIANGTFRQDLYYRLSAATIPVPPLRERHLDLPALARHFLAEEGIRAGAPQARLTSGALRRLQGYSWPGNVRELRNQMAYLATVAGGTEIRAEDLPDELQQEGSAWLSVTTSGGELELEPGQPRPLALEIRALERRRMAEALELAHGVRKNAAALIGMPLRTFVSKLKAHGLGDFPRGGQRGEGLRT